MKTPKWGMAVVVLFVALAMSLTVMPVAASPAVYPCNFYGTATVGGVPVAAGTEISAWFEGVQVASTVTGIGGLADNEYSLIVYLDEVHEGEDVSFKIGTLWANETGIWRKLQFVEVNLTTIKADTTPPEVVGTLPVDGAIGVAVDALVTATFDEDVTAIDLTGISIDGVTGVSATLDEATDTITIAHDDFAQGTEYTVTIPAGAVQDLASNPNAEYSWSFTTVSPGLVCTVELGLGWNTFSIPIAVDPASNTLGDLLTLAGLDPETDVEIAWYYYNDGEIEGWDIAEDYAMLPCDAIYIKMLSTGGVPIVPYTGTSISSKDVYAGWDLVGSAFLKVGDVYITELNVYDALISLYYAEGELKPWGYEQVISPGLNGNQEYWFYPRPLEGGGANIPNMLRGKGYWVSMANDDLYMGQTSTPWVGP